MHTNRAEPFAATESDKTPRGSWENKHTPSPAQEDRGKARPLPRTKAKERYLIILAIRDRERKVPLRRGEGKRTTTLVVNLQEFEYQAS